MIPNENSPEPVLLEGGTTGGEVMDMCRSNSESEEYDY